MFALLLAVILVACNSNAPVTPQAVTPAGTAASQPVLDFLFVQPRAATLESGQTQQFSVTAFDQFENPLHGLDITFTAHPAAGEIDGDGNFTAAKWSGIYPGAVTVEARDGYITKEFRTVQHHHRVLAEALNHAVKRGLVARNVATAVDPPRPVQKEIVNSTPADIQQLLATAQGTPYHDLIFTARYTGMRRGELLGLRWCDVDTDLATLSVDQTLQRRYGGEYIFKEPKTIKSRRLISLPPSLAILLRERKARVIVERSNLGLEFDERDLVFAQYDGSPLDPSTVSHTFSRIACKAGLPQMRFHDTRHAHASLMLRNGVHPKIVSERLGHSTIAVTIDLYSHVTPGLQEAAALRFEDALQVNHLEPQSEPTSVPV